jgi:hypothetical protein
VDRPTLSSPGNRSSVMSLALACAVLAVALAAVALIAALAIAGGPSAAALSNAALAGGVCWLAAAMSLCITCFGNWLQSPVQGVLGGMLVRMSLPLAALVVLPKLGGAFAAPGLSATILIVYLVALILETALALRMVPQQQTAHRKAVAQGEVAA